MLNPRLASRYAKSLVDLAVERNELEKVFSDIQWLQRAIHGSRDLANLLRSPIIKAEAKGRVLDAILAKNVSAMTSSFIHLVIDKGREGILVEIINAFIDQYKQHKRIFPIKLTTAVPIDDALKTTIIEQIRKTSDMHNIELESVVDGNIIGGFVLEAGDKFIDASIAHRLRLVSREFENNDFIYKLR